MIFDAIIMGAGKAGLSMACQLSKCCDEGFIHISSTRSEKP